MSLGYSQKEVARLAAIDQGEVSHIELGQTRSTDDAMKRVAAALHLPAEELLTLWEYCGDPVVAAILACDLPDAAKKELLGHYGQQRQA